MTRSGRLGANFCHIPSLSQGRSFFGCVSRLLVLLIAIECLSTFSYSQQTFPVDPQGSYIFVNTSPSDPNGLPDVVVPPLIIDLQAVGARPGDYLTLSAGGKISYSCYPNLPPSQTNCFYQPAQLCALFSTSDTINPPAPGINRVPGALMPAANSTPCVTYPTLFDGIPTDIPQDFFVNGTPTVIPQNAAYLIAAVPDIFYADNAGSPTLTVYVGCQVSPSAAPIKQTALPWGPLAYDHLRGKTIAGRGCALTSLNMSLNYEGEAWNPETLNSLLNDIPGGYGPGGNVSWIIATAASNGGRVGSPLVWDSLGGWTNSDIDLQGAEDTVERGICGTTRLPVIVRVKSQATHKHKDVGHFVLVTGEIVNSDGTKAFTINDPYYSNTVIGTVPALNLSGYLNGNQPEFYTRGEVRDPADLTALSIGVDAIANLLVTDPNGLQSGFTAGNPNPIQNIPHAGAGVDEVDDDVTGESGEPIQTVAINSPVTGAFQISLTGTALGVYSLVLGTEASDGSVQSAVVPGITNAGSVATYTVLYTPAPGSPINVTPVVTFASTLSDITNSFALGLINNGGVTNSLSQKVEAAQNASRNTRNNILNAFINEVDALSGTKITGVAPRVLVQDAESLMAH